MRTIWRKRLFDILRWPALAIGAATTTVAVANVSTDEEEGGWRRDGSNLDPVVLPNTLNVTATDRYAAHRSHRSHSSHRSHRSGSGGGYLPAPSPAPAPRTPPPSTTVPAVPKALPNAPSIIPKPTPIPKPAPQDLSMMVVRVQAALMRLGYYNGDIDGLLGAQTRSAITAYQKAQGLRQTGRMDINTLTKLGIPIP